MGEKKKTIWIDLGNSPHVPLFVALADEFTERGHKIYWTARDYAQTVEMARNAGLKPDVFGTHGGKNLFMKTAAFAGRVMSLIGWARGKGIDLVISHNSLEPLAVARLLRLSSVNMMDYEHHPNNQISFRLAGRVIVPDCFPVESLKKFGASEKKVRRYEGIKEDVYLSAFRPDPAFGKVLKGFDIMPEDILIVVRPHAPEALYNRKIENELLAQVLDKFAAVQNVKIILLPRKPGQGNELRRRYPQKNIIIPEQALDGPNLIAAADLVLSGGGTMNREAAALGVPTATIFTGLAAAVDDYLCGEGRMIRIGSVEDIGPLKPQKKKSLNLRAQTAIRKTVADLIMERP